MLSLLSDGGLIQALDFRGLATSYGCYNAQDVEMSDSQSDIDEKAIHHPGTGRWPLYPKPRGPFHDSWRKHEQV